MAESAPSRRRLPGAVLLATVALLAPPLLARFGPAPARRVLHALQLGALGDLGAADAGPLRFETTHRRVDDLAPGKRHAIVFAFTNGGDAPVAFVRTWASCGCVRVTTPDAVPTGGRGEVVVHLDTTGMRAQTTWQLAKVYTDAAPERPYLLMVEAGVR